MKVCFFGSFDRDYSKNVILIKGLRKQGVKIVECHHPNYFSVSHYTSLSYQFLKKARDCDIIFVAFFGHYDVLFAWVIAKIFQKKLIFDPLISIYNTRIEDRKYFKKGTMRAKFYRFFDSLNVILADHVFIDTYAQLEYYKKNFGLNENKVSLIRVGADDSVLKPTRNVISPKLKLLFYGSYQPSQGAKRIIEAANLLKNEDFEWLFIGRGQDRPAVENFARSNNLKKVTFVDTLPFSKLVSYINSANVVFGVFGNTIKTRMVIHNKIFQAIAMGRILITQDTPATREILRDGHDTFLVNPNPQAIAKKIMFIKKNRRKIERISKNARSTYLKNFTAEKIGKNAKQAFAKILNTS
jgi:glycosyltransferase involved in cell wall biosynthesis